MMISIFNTFASLTMDLRDLFIQHFKRCYFDFINGLFLKIEIIVNKCIYKLSGHVRLVVNVNRINYAWHRANSLIFRRETLIY